METIEKLIEFSNRKNIKLFIVGGYVRDFLMSKKSNDIDLLVENDAILFIKEFISEYGTTKARFYKKYKTVTLIEESIDICTARSEVFDENIKKYIISFGVDINEDLKRRDFTCNSIALQISPEKDFGKIIDPYNGIQDIKNKIIKPLHPNVFYEDPSRIKRAIDLENRYGFVLNSKYF